MPNITKNNDMELLIITGMSSAGRSTCANVLEDLGWYVVDNLPPQLLPAMASLTRGKIVSPPDKFVPEASPAQFVGLAAVVDVRSRFFFEALQDSLAELKDQKIRIRIVFLDATDDVLVRRQESVRRPHPLQGSGRILDGIAKERSMLTYLRETADVLMDTSGLNVTQLKAKVTQTFNTGLPSLRATVISFGFKYGIPLDADFVADMRFLPNPFWVEELRPHTGQEKVVSDYVLGQPSAQAFLDRYLACLDPVIAGYSAESKHYVSIAVGCTGGKHRSVAMAQALAKRLAEIGVSVGLLHRDLGRE